MNVMIFLVPKISPNYHKKKFVQVVKVGTNNKPLQKIFVTNKYMPYHLKGNFYLAKVIHLYV